MIVHRLQPGELVALPQARQLGVECRAGLLWITAEGVELLLRPGEGVRLDGVREVLLGPPGRAGCRFLLYPAGGVCRAREATTAVSRAGSIGLERWT